MTLLSTCLAGSQKKGLSRAQKESIARMFLAHYRFSIWLNVEVGRRRKIKIAGEPVSRIETSWWGYSGDDTGVSMGRGSQ
jgi:hypothetical protein